MTSLERLMSETGMTEMVARRHLDDRRKVIRLVASERREANRRAVREWLVTEPVADISDAEAFPEIAAAVAHARKLRAV